MMFSWVAGWCPRNEDQPLGAVPRGGAAAPPHGGRDVWSTGFRPEQVRAVQQGDEASLVVFGPCMASDEELRRALADARRGRWRAVGMLPGAYAAALHLGAERVVLGDLAGVERVYFARASGGVLWATAATPLAAFVGGGPRLDLLALDLAVYGIELYGGEVPLEGVEAVPPGWFLRMVAGRPEVTRWHEPPRSTSIGRTEALFRSTLVDVVERRSRAAGTLTADFSGGIDSSTLVVLAARDREVHGFTGADSPGSEDVRNAKAIAASRSRILHRVVPVDASTLGYGGLDRVEELPLTDLPTEAHLVLGPNRAILELAASRGSSDHLIGLGGDEVLSSRLTTLAGLLRARWLPGLGEAFRLAGRHRAPIVKLLGATCGLAWTRYPDALRRVADTVRTRAGERGVEPDGWRRDLAWCVAVGAAGWLTIDGARMVSERLSSLADEASEYPDPESAHDWQGVRLAAANVAGFRAQAERFGIELQMPFFDAAVLDLCLGLPGYLREPWPSFKPLVTAGMADLLPTALTRRTTKGRADYIQYGGIQRHQGTLRELIGSSRVVAAGILESSAVSKGLELEIAGVGPSTSIDRLFAAELWLERLVLHRDKWWKE